MIFFPKTDVLFGKMSVSNNCFTNFGSEDTYSRGFKLHLCESYFLNRGLTFTCSCSKSTIEALEKGVKYFQS